MPRIGVLMAMPTSDADAQAFVAAFARAENRLYRRAATSDRVPLGGRGEQNRLPATRAELVRAAGRRDLSPRHAPPAACGQGCDRDDPDRLRRCGDPVGSGFVASFARPGGNITGFSYHLSRRWLGKRLELLRELVPRVNRVAFLSIRQCCHRGRLTEDVKAAARARAWSRLLAACATRPRSIAAFARMRGEPNGGLIVMPRSF